MKTEFVQPSFEGARFQEHTLPVEVARDLAAYETLIVELAKRLYREDHPKRERVPRGFTDEFHLHIAEIDEGSTRPVLALVTAAALALSGAGDYFERARDLVAECIAAPDGQLPAKFPRDLLTHFNQIGRSLRADESLSLPQPQGKPVAVLTPQRRKNLVLAADRVYQREVELTGTIAEADWEKHTFRLRLNTGKTAVVPMESFEDVAREFGGRNRHQIVLKGVADFDSWDELQRVRSIESLEVQQDYEIAAQFESLASLTDGWAEGDGVAPDKNALAAVSEQIEGTYPEDLPVPAIVPTPEGDILFEWQVAGYPSLELRLTNMEGFFHALDAEGTGSIERTFDMASDGSWESFFHFLRTEYMPATA